MSESNSLLDRVKLHLNDAHNTAIIFDWDGTFVDSTYVNFMSMRYAVGLIGVNLDEAWFRAHSGISTHEMLHMLIDDDKASMIDQLAQQRNAYCATISHQITPFHDAVALAQYCHKLDINIAIGSGGSRPIIEEHLRSWNLSNLFPIIVGREDVTVGKPAPDCFLQAAEKIGIPPHDCLVIEDSDQGLDAARYAGMAAIDVRTLSQRKIN